MKATALDYACQGTTLYGHLYHSPQISQKRPAVIVAHAWRGLDSFAHLQAERLARLGYMAFAADLYGIQKPVETDEEAAQLMLPLFVNRKQLRERIVAAYEVVAKQPLVDADKIGAIGFCFGGLTVLELLRSGVGVRGVVSFHGVLGKEMKGKKAILEPISSTAKKSSILLLNGDEDPLVSGEAIADLQRELTEASVDWQFLNYGQTVHAFTNPEAKDSKGGLHYQERSARRSWKAMESFFSDLFVFG